MGHTEPCRSESELTAEYEYVRNYREPFTYPDFRTDSDYYLRPARKLKDKNMASMALGPAMGMAGGILGALNDAPTKAMTDLNNQIQDFSRNMTAQAKTEGIDASTTFQQLMQPLQRIVSGGPQQAGWSNSQVNAYNTQATQTAAASARNIKASLGTMGAPGVVAGNTNPAVAQAEATVEANKSNAISQGTIASDTAGREEFNEAAKQEKELPGVFATSNQANEAAGNEQQNAEKSQQAIDTAKKASSWEGIASKALSGAGGGAGAGGGMPSGLGGFLTQGIGNTSPDSNFGENVGNMLTGGANGGKGTMPATPDIGNQG
jgi:hypothetical protein